MDGGGFIKRSKDCITDLSGEASELHSSQTGKEGKISNTGWHYSGMRKRRGLTCEKRFLPFYSLDWLDKYISRWAKFWEGSLIHYDPPKSAGALSDIHVQ